MTEDKNETKKRIVPILTYEELKKMKNEGKKLPPGNYKIAENDKEEFLRSIMK